MIFSAWEIMSFPGPDTPAQLAPGCRADLMEMGDAWAPNLPKRKTAFFSTTALGFPQLDQVRS